MFLICISGSSGVGKTTISKILQNFFGSKSTLCISGDDLHRWERTNPIWDKITHFNPEANDLELGYEHILDLKSGKAIQRRIYNHDTGNHDSPKTLSAKDYVIYEGLHALYDQRICNISDLNIYVDTDEDLKTEWKIKRDTKKRGYTPEQVLITMEKRRVDETKYITTQKKNADIILKFTKTADNIDLSHINLTQRGEDYIQRIKHFYDSMNSFQKLSKWLSLEPSLVQHSGGNISVKCGTDVIIKASGCKISQINFNYGFCLIENDIDLFSINSEEEYNSKILEIKKSGDGRPSMEAGFHISIPNIFVVHTHPIHLNAILCSKQSSKIIHMLFNDMAYKYIPYVKPGLDLFKQINQKKTSENIIFLENHGLIVGSDSIAEVVEITDTINNRCKRWLGAHVDQYVDVENTNPLPLFPDAVIFPKEMMSTSNYIMKLMEAANLEPNYLSQSQVFELSGMASEKYRRDML